MNNYRRTRVKLDSDTQELVPEDDLMFKRLSEQDEEIESDDCEDDEN